jgi:hypothetical protein
MLELCVDDLQLCLIILRDKRTVQPVLDCAAGVLSHLDRKLDCQFAWDDIFEVVLFGSTFARFSSIRPSPFAANQCPWLHLFRLTTDLMKFF